MLRYRLIPAVTLTLGIGLASLQMPWSASFAQSDSVVEGGGTFTQAYLDDPENFATGKALWNEQCTYCHGKRAYPGKAPKLKPKKYTPEFVYQRVVEGFRGMPAWEGVYEDEELRAVVAYVMSRKFSP